MLTKEKFKVLLEDTPIIAAIKNDNDLELVLKSDINLVFVLYGDVNSMPGIINKLIDKHKVPFIHLDMVLGLSSNPVIVDYISSEYGKNIGIITTKLPLVKRAIQIDLRVIQRMFLLDSMSVESSIEYLKKGTRPDAIELMPGIIPKIINRFHREIKHIPIIAGGLITDKEEVYEVINNGGIAASTTYSDLWQA